MDNAFIGLVMFFIWVGTPALILAALYAQRKKVKLIFGSMYAKKTHKNGGLDPNDPTITKIDLVDISGLNKKLYTSK